MALKNVEQKKQKIVIETNLPAPEILEIFRKVDSKNIFLSLTMSYLNKLKNKDWEKIKKYIINITIDTESSNFKKDFKRLLDDNYSGHYLIANSAFLNNNLSLLRN